MTDHSPPAGAPTDAGPLPLASRMNELERQAGFVAAGLAVVMFAVVAVLGHAYDIKGYGLPYLGYGLLCAGTLAAAASWRNRYVGGFACVFIAGLRVPYGINLAYFALSGWYILRATQVARQTAVARANARRTARDARKAARGRGRGLGRGRSAEDDRAAGATTRGRRRAGREESAAASTHAPPGRSKRYTPPKS